MRQQAQHTGLVKLLVALCNCPPGVDSRRWLRDSPAGWLSWFCRSDPMRPSPGKSGAAKGIPVRLEQAEAQQVTVRR